MGKTAIITGISGQDGFYLASLLLSKGYVVIGLVRRTSNPSDHRLQFLNHQNLFIVEGDITDITSLYRIIRDYKPDEFYHLAAQSLVCESFKTPISTMEINAIGTLNCLEAIRNVKPDTKFLFAASSEMFGNQIENEEGADNYIILNEYSRMEARSPYGASKICGFNMTKNYREAYGLFACSSICFNHESPLRGENFVTRKITKGVADILIGQIKNIRLGNIKSKRDWSFAGDMVRGMYMMLQQNKADDFVFASGKAHSIEDFLVEAFRIGGQNVLIDHHFKGISIDEILNDSVIIDSKFFRPSDIEILIGDASKAQRELQWKSTVSFGQLVRMMVNYDMASDIQKRTLIGDALIERR